MVHPLAADMSINPILRRAFSAVTYQVVRHYADGYEWSYNLNRTQTPAREEIAAVERARVGSMVDGRYLVSIEVRAI